MKIFDYNGAESLASMGKTQEPQKAERSGSALGGAAKSAQSGDTVEFSAGLGQLSKAISSYGADRSRQVDALAALYQSGNYRPDSVATSRAMISEASIQLSVISSQSSVTGVAETRS
jgi:anti-sigma28 factor (negative regulator of flagellin synthesis)